MVQTVFKSYYVVWKLNFVINTSLAKTKFKSYYVVWKHKKNAFAITSMISLNRTMQYGNLYTATDKEGENAV